MNRKLLVCAARVPLALATLLLLLVWLDPWLSTATPVDTLLLNAAPVAGLFGTAFALARRVALAMFATACLLALAFYINEVKLQQLETPLMLSDFGLMAQFMNEIGLFVRYSHGAILLVVLAIVAVAGVGLWWIEGAAFRWRGAVAAGIVAAALLSSLNTAPVKRLYVSSGVMDRPWVVDREIRENGLMTTLAASVYDLVLPRPERDPASYAKLRDRMLEAAGSASAVPAVLPDIILVLGESFFDPGLLRNVDTCAALPRWCELRARGVEGQMHVPTYGGNTTRTEFELLTGVPYRALPRPVYPYNAIVIRPTASVAWWLHGLGYRNTAIHPHSANFWRRHQALPWLGFGEFIAEETFGPHHRAGPFISDADLAEKVLTVLNRDAPSPGFVFAISMEGHGPWGSRRRGVDPAGVAAVDVPAELDGEAALALRQYILHARNAVAALARLEQVIHARPEPALLIFFGDHLPTLEPTFSRLGFDNDLEAYLQTTPYLALANFEMSATWSPRASHELGHWALRLAGPAAARTFPHPGFPQQRRGGQRRDAQAGVRGNPAPGSGKLGGNSRGQPERV